MEITDVVSIDLNEFGFDDVVEMGMPSIRQVMSMRNEISRITKLSSTNGSDVNLEGVLQGDIELYSVLMYVRKAPFRLTKESFLDFCDKVHEADPMADSVLFARMQAVAMEMERIRSPFVNSRAQVTVSSE